MTDMRVKLLLDFVKRGRAGKEARDELKGIKSEADKLKSAGGPDKLNRSLGHTSTKARKLAGDLAKAKAEAKALGATDARPRVPAYNRLKEMAPPKDRAKDMFRASAAGAGGAAVAAMGAGGMAGTAGVGAAAIAATQFVKTSMTLETAQKELGITTGETDEAIAQATNTFRKLSGSFGEGPTKMVQTAQLFAASGQDFKTAIAATSPSLKTAKASFSEVSDVATAGIAAIQNLNVPVSSLQEAYDRMAMSAKLGQVEMKNLAAELPAVAASYSKVGSKGLEGVSDLTSQLQIMRKETSSASEAANRLQNLYDKITGEETLKSFKEEGVDLQKEILAGEKKGIAALDTTLKLIEKITRKKDGSIDPFKMTNLFGDVQARQAAMAMIKYRDEAQKMRQQITNEAAGTVERDFRRASARIEAGIERLGSAFETLRGRLGERLHPAVTSIAEAIGVPIEKLNSLLERLDTAADKTKKLEDAARRIVKGEGTPEDTATVAASPKGVAAVANATVTEARDQSKKNTEASSAAVVGITTGEQYSLQAQTERENIQKQISAIEAAQRAGTATAAQVRGLSGLRRELAMRPAEQKPSMSGETVRAAAEIARQKAAIEENVVKEQETARLRVLKDLAPNAPAPPQPNAAPEQQGPMAPSKMPVPPTRPALEPSGKPAGVPEQQGPPTPTKLSAPAMQPKDLKAALTVDMQPAGALMADQIADGLKSGQGKTDGAAQQIGDGVKGKLSAVDAAAAGQQAMASFAQGITAGGQQAVAAAQQVAAQVQSALKVNVAGLGSGGSVRSKVGGALHDGVG